MPNVFWSGWNELMRVLVVGTFGYIAVVLLLRGAGQQALTKMNAYGFVVTVALGSALATSVLSSQVKIDKAILSFALLLILQRLCAILSQRFDWFRRMVNNEPSLVFHAGRMLPDAMFRKNITEAELNSAIRSKGFGGHEQIEAVILETDGSFSVVPSNRCGDGDANPWLPN